jgi:hypothetical protein
MGDSIGRNKGERAKRLRARREVTWTILSGRVDGGRQSVEGILLNED